MTSRSSGTPDFNAFEWDDEERDESSFFDAVTPLAAAADDQVDGDSASGDPPEAEVKLAGPAISQPVEAAPARQRSPRQQIDPMFAYMVLMALSFGLVQLATTHPIGRYSILWTLLAVVGIAAVMLRRDPLTITLPVNDLLWGLGWGSVVGLPLLLLGAGLLSEVSARIYVGMPDGAVFQSIVFVMVPVETVFFRGLLQEKQSLLVTAMLASGWGILMFFPTMDVFGYWSIALIAGTFLIMLNVFYSYIRQRNGLTAAWICQTIVSLAWLFVPRLLV
jgi:hypothetical protein